MICQKCGTKNLENAIFCVNCGAQLINENNKNEFDNQIGNMSSNTTISNNTINENAKLENQTVDISSNSATPTNLNNGSIEMQSDFINKIPTNQQQSNNFSNNKVDFANPNISNYQNTNLTTANDNINMYFSEYFNVIALGVIKPFSLLNTKSKKLSNFKNSIILSIIVCLFFVIVMVIKTIYATVRVTTGGFFSEAKTEWVWENINEIEFGKLIFSNFFIIFGIIITIALVYYIVGLILKKQPIFSKLLGYSTISTIPVIICNLILSPLLVKLYEPLGSFITIIGVVYTLIILYEYMNSEIITNNNQKFYFNLVCLSIILIVCYFIYTKFFIAPANDLNDIFDLFNY